MTFVTMCIVQTRARINQLVWVIVLSLGFFGVKGGLFSVLTGGHYRVYGPDDSFIADNNSLALALIVLLPLMQYLRTNAPRRWLRLGMTGAMGLTTFAILGSYSRGALIGLTVVLGLLLLKGRHRVVTVFVVGTIFALGLFMAPSEWSDRMDTIGHAEDDQSFQGRLDAWTFAYKLALDHPFVGGGQLVGTDDRLFKQYVPNAPSRAAHSIYFEVLGETGFIGLAWFLFLLASSYFTSGKIIRLTRKRLDLAWANSLARMLQISILGYAVTGAALSLGFFDLYYALVAIVTVTLVVVKRELAKVPTSAADEAQLPRDPAEFGRTIPAMARAVESGPVRLAGS
jgi:probable O-glycosylation ligase (exosortase A-associated)